MALTICGPVANVLFTRPPVLEVAQDGLGWRACWTQWIRGTDGWDQLRAPSAATPSYNSREEAVLAAGPAFSTRI